MECITEVENSSMTFALTDSDKKQLRSNYYDLLKTVGGKILTMETMYGMINPKLWNDPTTKKSPTKKKK